MISFLLRRVNEILGTTRDNNESLQPSQSVERSGINLGFHYGHFFDFCVAQLTNESILADEEKLTPILRTFIYIYTW